MSILHSANIHTSMANCRSFCWWLLLVAVTSCIPLRGSVSCFCWVSIHAHRLYSTVIVIQVFWFQAENRFLLHVWKKFQDDCMITSVESSPWNLSLFFGIQDEAFWSVISQGRQCWNMKAAVGTSQDSQEFSTILCSIHEEFVFNDWMIPEYDMNLRISWVNACKCTSH